MQMWCVRSHFPRGSPRPSRRCDGQITTHGSGSRFGAVPYPVVILSGHGGSQSRTSLPVRPLLPFPVLGGAPLACALLRPRLPSQQPPSPLSPRDLRRSCASAAASSTVANSSLALAAAAALSASAALSAAATLSAAAALSLSCRRGRSAAAPPLLPASAPPPLSPLPAVPSPRWPSPLRGSSSYRCPM